MRICASFAYGSICPSSSVNSSRNADAYGAGTSETKALQEKLPRTFMPVPANPDDTRFDARAVLVGVVARRDRTCLE